MGSGERAKLDFISFVILIRVYLKVVCLVLFDFGGLKQYHRVFQWERTKLVHMFVVKENEKMFIRKHQEYDRLPIDEYLREVAWAEGLVMDKNCLLTDPASAILISVWVNCKL